jgi:putative hydrolase of the HAD superfamily
MAEYFSFIEIVSEKTGEVYLNILKKLNCQPQEFLMVGNSVKSDIMPAINIGAQAVHIPFHITWQHEEVAKENLSQTFFQLETIQDILKLLPEVRIDKKN